MDSRQWKAGAAALACGFLAAVTASAGTPDSAAGYLEARTITVRVDDLNQASDAGAQAMYSRLRDATRRVCGAPERDLRQATAVRACRQQTLAEAVASANVPRVTALHESRTGQRQRAAGARVAATR